MTDLNIARPHLSLLSSEQIQQIHQDCLAVLSRAGMRVDSAPVRELLAQRLGEAAVQDGVVRFPPEVVEWAIRSAPATIDIYDRLGNPAFTLGRDRTRFGIGVTTLFYQEPQHDDLLPFQRQHMRDMVRLGQRLPRFDVISTVGIIQDVDAQIADLYMSLEMVANTTKPLVILVSNEERFNDVLDLLETLAGDLATKPFVLPYFNPVTPLVMNQGTVEKMEIAIQRGLPVIFSNYSLAGMSTPITPAGMLTLLVAELLGGLTIGQLMKAGAPMVLGILPAFMDMKTMTNFYDPQSMLLNLACAEMMSFYNIPHCGTSGSGTGWGPDVLAAETYWMNHLTTCLTKGGLAPFVGDTLTSKAFSPVNVVYVHEIIEQAIRYSEGFSLEPENVGLEEIIQVAAGGSFLSTPLTRKHYRKAYYPSPIFPRLSLEKWQSQGQPSASSVLRSYTLQLLADLQAPPDSEELIQQGEAFIQTRLKSVAG